MTDQPLPKAVPLEPRSPGIFKGVLAMFPDPAGEYVRLSDAQSALQAKEAEIAALKEALRIHHEWSIKNLPGYSEHGDERVAYRATVAALREGEGN